MIYRDASVKSKSAKSAGRFTQFFTQWGKKKGLRNIRKPLILLAGATRLELATSGVTAYRTLFCISF
jgi:hypothetical protein